MKLLISRSLTWWIQGLSSTCPVFKYFQGIIPILSNLGEKVQVLSRMRGNPAQNADTSFHCQFYTNSWKIKLHKATAQKYPGHMLITAYKTTGSSSVHILPSHHSLWLYDYQSLRQGCLWPPFNELAYNTGHWLLTFFLVASSSRKCRHLILHTQEHLVPTQTQQVNTHSCNKECKIITRHSPKNLL